MNMWLLFRMPGDGTGAPPPVKVVAIKRPTRSAGFTQAGGIAPAAPEPVA
jgi:hypothetical protein